MTKATTKLNEVLFRFNEDTGELAGYHITTITKVFDDADQLVHASVSEPMNILKADSLGYTRAKILSEVDAAALSAVSSLTAEKAVLEADLELARRERDAAMVLLRAHGVLKDQP